MYLTSVKKRETIGTNVMLTLQCHGVNEKDSFYVAVPLRNVA